MAYRFCVYAASFSRSLDTKRCGYFSLMVVVIAPFSLYVRCHIMNLWRTSKQGNRVTKHPSLRFILLSLGMRQKALSRSSFVVLLLLSNWKMNIFPSINWRKKNYSGDDSVPRKILNIAANLPDIAPYWRGEMWHWCYVLLPSQRTWWFTIMLHIYVVCWIPLGSPDQSYNANKCYWECKRESS